MKGTKRGKSKGVGPPAPSYTVSLVRRILDLFPDWDLELGPDVHLEYSWNHGYERTFVQRDGGGSAEYRGCYHPNGVCETGGPDLTGICEWCGATLW